MIIAEYLLVRDSYDIKKLNVSLLSRGLPTDYFTYRKSYETIMTIRGGSFSILRAKRNFYVLVRYHWFVPMSAIVFVYLKTSTNLF